MDVLMYQRRMCGGSGAGCLQDVGRLFVGRNGSVGGVLIGGRGRGIGSEGRTLSDASAGVAAVGASVLLDVERARTCGWIVRQHFGSEEKRLIESGRRRRVVGVAYRSVCTERASCCGACRKIQYPWLRAVVSYPDSIARGATRAATNSF
jgi:hypothetical protein